MHLIDTHAHLYLPEFEQDLPEILQRATAKGIQKILMPAIDATTHSRMLQMEEQHPECMAMMGLHPCSVTDKWEQEIALIEQYLNQRRFIAIGEIGLDFYWDKTFTGAQYDAFHRQIQLALQYRLPIVIHSRNALDECIGVVGQYPTLTGVFHCFSGNAQQALAVQETGFYLGIGGVATFKNAGLDKVLAETGIEKVILETDAPYLAPAPYRGKRNEPAYVELVAQKLEAITGLSLEKISQITTENARKLFQLS